VSEQFCFKVSFFCKKSYFREVKICASIEQHFNELEIDAGSGALFEYLSSLKNIKTEPK